MGDQMTAGFIGFFKSLKEPEVLRKEQAVLFVGGLYI
jgi:hypothetical protein